MNAIRRTTHGLTALGLTAAGLVGGASAATAVPADIPCEGYTVQIVSQDTLWRPAQGQFFRAGPGGTMSETVTETSKIVATFGTTVETEMGAIFAKVKGSVSASVSREVGVTRGKTYTRTLKDDHYGHMQYGSWGWQVRWRIVDNVDRGYNKCEPEGEVLDSGVAKLPGKAVGWKFWQTKN